MNVSVEEGDPVRTQRSGQGVRIGKTDEYHARKSQNHRLFDLECSIKIIWSHDFISLMSKLRARKET